VKPFCNLLAMATVAIALGAPGLARAQTSQIGKPAISPSQPLPGKVVSAAPPAPQVIAVSPPAPNADDNNAQVVLGAMPEIGANMPMDIGNLSSSTAMPPQNDSMVPGGGDPDPSTAAFPSTTGDVIGDTSATIPSANGVENEGATDFSVVENQTRVITVSREIADVIVSDPKIVSVTPLNANRLVVFGITDGVSSVMAVDAKGNPIVKFVVTVTPDGYKAQSTAHLLAPGINVTTLPNGGMHLTGTVNTPLEAYRANQMAQTLAGNANVIDDLKVGQSQQVMLKVRIAEVSRTVTQELGINWQTMGQVGSSGLMIGTGAAAPAEAAKLAGTTTGTLIGSGSPGSYTLQLNNLDGILNALDEDSLARMLAEPTLTALSGHTASFLSGGSFPVPTPGANGQVSVSFQNFGVQLQFTPIVMSSGQIYMNVAPTISQISAQDSVTVPTGGSALVVPSLVEQQAQTTVMLGSGQTFAIAGLLQDQTQQSDQTVPGLGDLPVVGGAFRADSFQRSQNELVILVTPYIVTPQDNPNALQLPGGNDWNPPNLVQRFLYGKEMGTPTAQVNLPTNVGLELQ
jgi:pilus assembly protein CpaC